MIFFRPGPGFALALFLCSYELLQPVSARPQALAGPVPAFVERVVDGDTLVVRARIWLGQELRVMVRIGGIDAPELKGRCRRERLLAVSARQFVKRRVGQRRILLTAIRQGKYAGRVIANVVDKDGSRLADSLLEARLARPYRQGRRKSWCKARRPPAHKESTTLPYQETFASR